VRIAIFSDVHANLPALEAVLAEIDAEDPGLVLCLGDLVGYATWPNEVVTEVRRRRIPTIAGNYDEGVGRASDDCGCAYRTEVERERGRRSIAFTNEVVTPGTRAYLRSLPRHLSLDLGTDAQPFRVLLVHGSPRKINEYLFEDRPDRSFLRLLTDAGADAMIFGHTHRPFWKRLRIDGDGRVRHAVNTGSVGKPKDGDPRACWTLVELPERPSPDAPEVLRVTFRRVEYDVERAARAIEESPLPDAFAHALRDAQ
jgi:diadenosine tetraphosphatase ApaH/serine/threonine PP2A family protein phosphatase